MKFFMNLRREPFEKIKSGKKSVELRLYDEKRRKIKSGDIVEFTSESGEKITARVIAMHVFANFEELYKSVPLEKCGYEDTQKASHTDMYAFYTPEEEKVCGVVGIELKVV